MIIGIGNDLIKTSRIKALLIKNKQRFLNRIFTPKEVSLTENFSNIERLSSYVAKRFAAKEAFSKAFGTGIGAKLSFQDIEIFKTENGKPYIEFNQKNNYNIHLSMTDETCYAQAFVIIETI